jgi:hypothetical protein
VGLTYNKVKEAYSVGEGEKLCCMIALAMWWSWQKSET